jgi:hypothetical protein
MPLSRVLPGLALLALAAIFGWAIAQWAAV